jgi:hypothetical protein
MMRRGDLASASDSFDTFLNIMQRVAAAESGNLDVQSRVAIAYSKVGDVLSAQ